MKPHPLIRAYMAGVVLPSIFMLLSMGIYAWHRFYLEVPSQFVVGLPAAPLARALVFPIAVIPNVWGLWNVVHAAMRPTARLPIGAHGALLPLILIPIGVTLAGAFDVFHIQFWYAAPVIPLGMAFYYLVWKYAVSFLNAEVGIA
jgi:hypothetical protein